MARSDVQTFGLLNRWPIRMRENSWNWNQIAGPGAPLSTDGRVIYVQEERDFIADALNQAVHMMAESLGFYPRPTWLTQRLKVGYGFQEIQRHKLDWGYIQQFGFRNTSLIDDDAAVVYTDADGDGVADTATITVTTTVAAAEIKVFFRVADGAISAGHEYWEIEPLTVTTTGAVATITGPRYLFVDPGVVWAVPYESPNYTNKNSGSTSDATDFVTLVDVYRVYNDTTSANVIISDPIYCDACGSTLGGNTSTAATGRIVDERLSIVQVRPTSCCTACGYWPETIDVRYQAGLPLVQGQMDRRLETAIIRLANTLMPEQPETFDDKRLGMWKRDREPANPAQLTQLDMHPFGGTMWGRIEAWRSVKHLVLGKGGKVTARWV